MSSVEDAVAKRIGVVGVADGGVLLFFTLNREDFSFVIHLDRQPRTSRRREAQTGSRGCLRCLLLVMCTYPFSKKALTLHLPCGEGRERYFGCNLMQRKVLASSHQHLMAEAPGADQFRHFVC